MSDAFNPQEGWPTQCYSYGNINANSYCHIHPGRDSFTDTDGHCYIHPDTNSHINRDRDRYGYSCAVSNAYANPWNCYGRCLQL